jgi:peptide deformylase
MNKLKNRKLKIIVLPNPVLRQKSKPVSTIDEELLKLIDGMISLLEGQEDPQGAGLSAVQVGVLKRIFVARIRGRILPFINPEILKFSKDKTSFLEGCLSIPDFYGHVARPAEITLKYQNTKRQILIRNYKGLAARTIQHEVDHLNGILFIDHIHAQNQKLYKYLGKDGKGQDKFAEVILA